MECLVLTSPSSSHVNPPSSSTPISRLTSLPSSASKPRPPSLKFGEIDGKTTRSTSLSLERTGPEMVLNSVSSSAACVRIVRQCIESGNVDGALKSYVKMRGEGAEFGVVLETILVDKLMKAGRVGEAFQVFEEMSERNVVTWTSVISGCVQNNSLELGLSLFVEMLQSGILPNDYTFSVAFQACADLEAMRVGSQVHSLTIKAGLALSCRLQNSLVHLYSKCGLLGHAEKLFKRILEPDLVSFTSMISGFSRNDVIAPAFELLDRMRRLGIEPNEHTISSMLASCWSGPGMQVHAYMIKTSLDQTAYSASALIEFYFRNSCIEEAELVFEKFDFRNVITWSLMVSCYLENGLIDEAIQLFCEMFYLGIEPNEFTYASVIGSCGLCSVTVKVGLQLHGSVIKLNLQSDNRVCNALLSMYSRMGKVEESAKVFEKIQDPDIVSWCAAVSGYSQNGFGEKSASLLLLMQRKGIKPNEYGLSSALSSCGNLAVLDQGRLFHGFALKLGCTFDVCVGNALVSMYAKCGSIGDSWLAFDDMPFHDITSWNSLIHGYAHHGYGRRALQAFDEMLDIENLVPNHATFMGVLSACSHAGYLDEGFKCFKFMDQYGLEPSMLHYACLVDMMGRAGRLEEAADIIYEMPFEPDSLIWKALAGSCRIHKNIALGRFAAKKAIALEPEDSANYVLLSNMLAIGGEHEGANKTRKLMEKKGLRKEVGLSWIDAHGEIHAFKAGDRSHSSIHEIYETLEKLLIEMRWEGYSPDLSFFFHD